MTAIEKLEAACRSRDSLLCLGLDPDPERLPAHLGTGPEAVLAFNEAILEATCDRVAACKPNLAFYEAMGIDGWRVLEATLRRIPPEMPVILDAKRGDIGATARMYARAIFDRLGADAVTVNPYLGREALQPFVAHADKLTFVLAATSNPGAGELQDLEADGLPLYRRIARMAAELDGRPGAVGLVVGATVPEKLAAVRAEAPSLWILLPGVGAQGGALDASLAAGLDARGQGLLVTVSRAILYADGGRGFAEAAREAAVTLDERIRRIRDALRC